ncbi:MAG: hypothetical protein D6689_14260 [Deltaproteobacteria bacterium]|nr:MAG: hypothetical protein D6689_14260 [Deltaproteobacteria bacterium]
MLVAAGCSGDDGDDDDDDVTADAGPGGTDGGGGGCGSTEPAALPAELGIVDDDADWLCGNLPEAPQEDDNLGQVIAGATSCLGQSGPAVAGKDVWVAPDGSDAASGANRNQALATLREALCRVAPGQTIHIEPGTYLGAAAVAALGDANSETIVIRGEGDAPSDVVLDCEHWRSAAITLGESFNIRIENLTVQHCIDAGIQTLNGAGVTIDNVVSRNNGRCSVNLDSEGEGFGLNLVGTKNVAVTNSVFEDNGPLLARVLCGEVLGTGINTFAISGRVANNTIRRTRGGAMLIEDGDDATVEDNLGEHNFLLALNNYWDAGLWIDGAVGVTARNNTFKDNYGGVGIIVSDSDNQYPDGRSKNVTIQGNTIDGHLAGIHVWGFGACPPPSDVVTNYATLEADNTLTNNAFQGDAFPIRCDEEFFGGVEP